MQSRLVRGRSLGRQLREPAQDRLSGVEGLGEFETGRRDAELPQRRRIFWDTAAALDSEADLARGRHFSSPLIRSRELVAAFEGAGLRSVRPASLTIRMEYAEFKDYWEPIASAQGPVGDYVKRLPPDRLETLATAVRRAYWLVNQMALDPWPRPRGRRAVWSRDPIPNKEEQ
jgi:hypothetical protein